MTEERQARPPRAPEATRRWRRLSSLEADGPDEMGVEIAAGPAAVDESLAELQLELRPLRDTVAAAARIVLVGTGASLAVARAAAPLWVSSRARAGGRCPVIVRESSAAVLGPTDGTDFEVGDLAIVLSQSGTSPETLSAARRAHRLGASVLAVTAHREAAIAVAADRLAFVRSGEENGASTKSELATLAVLLAIGGRIEPDVATRIALRAALEAALHDWRTAAGIGVELAGAERLWIVGFGSALGIAAAGDLLWHEKVRRPAAGTTPSEFRHGLVEAARAADAVVVVEVDEPVPARTAYLELLADEVGRLGARLIRVAPAGTFPGPPAGAVDVTLRLSPERGAPLEALLRIQQLARATAHAAGTYVDGFEILRSVVLPAAATE